MVSIWFRLVLLELFFVIDFNLLSFALSFWYRGGTTIRELSEYGHDVEYGFIHFVLDFKLIFFVRLKVHMNVNAESTNTCSNWIKISIPQWIDACK